MSVMKALDPPETVYTREGKKRATHEAYSYHITPYKNPPVKLEMVKGFIDKHGQFLAIPATIRALDITLTEFRELISPTPQGKPAGDFRLSDVLTLVKRRIAEAPKSEGPKAAAPETAAAEASNPKTADASTPAPADASSDSASPEAPAPVAEAAKAAA